MRPAMEAKIPRDQLQPHLQATLLNHHQLLVLISQMEDGFALHVRTIISMVALSVIGVRN